MKKRYLAGLLAMTMSLLLVACGDAVKPVEEQQEIKQEVVASSENNGANAETSGTTTEGEATKDNSTQESQEEVELFTGEIDGFVIEQGNLLEYRGEATDIVIPEGVRCIAVNAFSKNIITSVVFPKSLTSVGTRAFSNQTELTSITFSDGVSKIYDQAFENCTNLVSVTIPASVNSIGKKAFQGCKKLESAVILESPEHADLIIRSIGDYAFRDCKHLKLSIPDSITDIGQDALESVTVYCNAGSYAEQYAKDNFISYEYMPE